MAGDVRIAVIGQAAFGESVLNALVEKGEEVVGVFCPPDREGRRPDPIKVAAEGHGVPVLQFRRMRTKSVFRSADVSPEASALTSSESSDKTIGRRRR